MFDRLFGNSSTVLSKALSGLSARQRAAAENIANVDTPGYKRVEVTFERELAKAAGKLEPGRYAIDLATTQPGHMALDSASDLAEASFRSTRSDETTLRNDGNNVDIDTEMTKLTQTSFTYGAVADLMKRKMSGLHSVIRGN
jgi:flagellar basal-body rod protein FlgB